MNENLDLQQAVIILKNLISKKNWDIYRSMIFCWIQDQMCREQQSFFRQAPNQRNEALDPAPSSMVLGFGQDYFG
jgi:hypothetical protein